MELIDPNCTLYEQLVRWTPPEWGPFLNTVVDIISVLSDNVEEYNGNFTPRKNEIFTMMWKTPLNRVRVIILGEDPYPTVFKDGVTEAVGMSFSGRKGRPIPRSLGNVFKELDRQYNYTLREHMDGDLSKWAEQGVLLLNSKLIHSPVDPQNSKRNMWEGLVTEILKACSIVNPNCILVLWGMKAQKLVASFEDITKRYQDRILKSGHPSPLNRTGSFENNNHFLTINSMFTAWGQPHIDWNTH